MKPVTLGLSVFALSMIGLAAHAETACADLTKTSLPHRDEGGGRGRGRQAGLQDFGDQRRSRQEEGLRG